MQPRNNNQKLTQTQYARRLGLNRSTVSRQVRDGIIPTDKSGLIDPVVANRARAANLDQSRGRHKAQPVDTKKAATPAKPAAVEPDVPTAESVIRCIHQWRDRLPALFFNMGAPRGVALLSAEVLDALLLGGLGNVAERIFGPTCGPAGETPQDFARIAASLGVSQDELEKLYDARCEKWSEGIFKFFDGDPNFSDGLAPITQ